MTLTHTKSKLNVSQSSEQNIQNYQFNQWFLRTGQ